MTCKELKAYSATGPLFQALDAHDEADRLSLRNVMSEARDRAEVQRRALSIPAAAIAETMVDRPLTDAQSNELDRLAAGWIEHMVDEASIRAEARRRAMAYLEDTNRLTWKDYFRAGLLIAAIVVLWALVIMPFITLWRR